MSAGARCLGGALQEHDAAGRACVVSARSAYALCRAGTPHDHLSSGNVRVPRWSLVLLNRLEGVYAVRALRLATESVEHRDALLAVAALDDAENGGGRGLVCYVDAARDAQGAQQGHSEDDDDGIDGA